MFSLRFPSICQQCECVMRAGTKAHYRKGRGVRCRGCGPHPKRADLETYQDGGFTVTVIPEVKHRELPTGVISKSAKRGLAIAKSQNGKDPRARKRRGRRTAPP